MTDTDKIRILLDRYYGGTSSPDDERRLGDLLAEARDLPADLEADRALFAALRDAADCIPDIPRDADARITSALEAEMARGRRAAGMTFRRRVIWTLSGAAACLLAMFAAYNFVPGRTDSVPADAVAVNVRHHEAPVQTVTADTVVNAAPHSPLAPAYASAAVDNASGPRKARRIRRHDSPGAIASADNTADETEMLIAANYHVVEDEREADAIISSIFGRMEGNLAQETNRIDEIGVEYECEVNKLCSY